MQFTFAHAVRLGKVPFNLSLPSGDQNSFLFLAVHSFLQCMQLVLQQQPLLRLQVF